MITKFKLFENDQNDFYILSLDEIWNIYENNFSIIYPDVKLRKKDIKTICYYYRLDIPKILISKNVELTIYDNFDKIYINGKISDVWTRYYAGGFGTNWQYKFKINNKWRIVKNNDIKIFNTKNKTELEKDLNFLLSVKKYNL